MKKMNFSNIHVFPFSPRQGTPAEKMPGRVVGEERDKRLEVLKTIKTDSAAAFTESMIGKEETVLVETKRSNGVCEGWSGNYLKIRFKDEKAEPKTLVRVVCRKILPDGALVAEVVQ